MTSLMSAGNRVQLTRELDDLQLHTGEVGVLVSVWQAPTPAYEVEFQLAGQPMRVLLLEHQIAWHSSN
ncbi:MAG TPA: DUF4926 domain-containing protein [Tepidisphaeraceae bacterium]|nr:DUF4926 domain-containing protein [Tepidisphaeraceae bacterium]